MSAPGGPVLGAPAAPGTGTTAWGRALHLGLVAAGLAAAVALRLPLCPFALVTRHPCPGCGMTRASLALATGHVREAIGIHPLVIPVAPLAALVVLAAAYNYVRHGRFASVAFTHRRWATPAAILLGAAMTALWIARFFGAFGGPVPVG